MANALQVMVKGRLASLSRQTCPARLELILLALYLKEVYWLPYLTLKVLAVRPT